MREGWTRLPKYEVPGCNVYVQATSWLLLPPAEREDTWLQHVQARSSTAAQWLDIMEALLVQGAPAGPEQVHPSDL